MSEKEIRFSFSPEEEAAVRAWRVDTSAAKVYREVPSKSPHNEIEDPQAVLKKNGHLDLGAKGAFGTRASGKSFVERRR